MASCEHTADSIGAAVKPVIDKIKDLKCSIRSLSTELENAKEMGKQEEITDSLAQHGDLLDQLNGCEALMKDLKVTIKECGITALRRSQRKRECVKENMNADSGYSLASTASNLSCSSAIGQEESYQDMQNKRRARGESIVEKGPDIPEVLLQPDRDLSDDLTEQCEVRPVQVTPEHSPCENEDRKMLLITEETDDESHI